MSIARIRGARAGWVLLAAAAAVAIASAAVCTRGEPRARRWRPPARATALDAERLRAHVAARMTAARRMASVTAPRPPAPQATGVAVLLRQMIAPTCAIGPAELCALIADTVDACAAGDARACLAVGQYLEEAPPYPVTAGWFYVAGCKLGDADACARDAQIRAGSDDCTVDRLACLARARRDGDLATLDRVCADGVADACGALAAEYVDEPALLHRYLTTGCQAGGTPACAELARRLAPSCAGACLPSDPAQATIAATIACDAGFADVCGLAAP